MNYGLNKKSNKRKQFLLKLLAIAMVISMMPYQSLSTAYAAEPESVPSSTESADPTGTQNDQGEVDQTEGDQNQDDVDKQDVDKQEEPQKDPPKVTKEEPKKGATKGNRDGGTTLTPKQQADIYYGEGGGGGTARTYVVSLTETGNHTTAEAGEMISYNVDISMWPAATYAYNGQDQKAMFDEWENITIKLKLPSQQIINGVVGNAVSSFEYDSTDDVWIIHLTSNKRDATNSNSITFDVNTRITGNGALADGTVLELPGTDPAIGAEVTVEAEFNLIVDEYGHTDPSIPPYKFSASDTTNPITLTTPDEWKLTKNSYAAPNNYTLDKTNKTVTVHYLIKYGLDVGGAPSEDPNVYTSIGRVPFDHDIKLTDTPTLTLANGSTLDAQSVIVTPAHTGYKYKNGDSADEGGSPKPIDATSGQVSLPYAVVGTNNKYVDENAPAFSEYKVDMVYNYDDFMVWYYENLENTDALSQNTAKIVYQLLGQPDPKNTQGSNQTTIPTYIPPGKITITKDILNYTGDDTAPYDGEIKAPVTGPATYKIYKSNGTTEATLWYKDAQGKYRAISGNTVTINPSAAASHTNGTDGTISFYLDAGTYVIKETGKPAYTKVVGSDTQSKTVDENGEVTAAFVNQEELGQIKIHKKDDTSNENPVSGVKFGLYKDSNHTQKVLDAEGNHITATTNNSGNATFERLIPDTYYVWEMEAPEGYVKDPVAKKAVVVANDENVQTINVINHVDGKIIYLQKQYSTVADPNNFIDVTGDWAAFNNAFALEQSINGTTWTPVLDNDGNPIVLSIDNLGKSNVAVSEYDNQERKIRYRFVETIPDGYYPESGDARTQTSRVVIPADCTSQDDLTVVMKNRRNGIIELTKKKVTVNSNSGVYTAANQSGKTFKLYGVPDGSTAADYIAQATTDSNGKIKFSDLPAVNSSSKEYTYYVVEQNTDTGYTWETDSTIKIDGVDTKALKIGSFADSTDGTLTSTAYNIQQDIVIGIVKRNKLTNGQLANAKFKVSDGTNEWTITSKSSGNATLEIALGKNYTITETEVPAGYYLDADPNPVSINTTGWKVKRQGNTYVIVDANGDVVNTSTLVFTFKDTPQKKLRVTKKQKKKGTTSTSSLSNIKFDIYVKDSEGHYVPYKVNGTAVTIKADGSSTVALPEGDYYLHEQNPPSTVVNPDLHPGDYFSEFGDNVGVYDTTSSKFFFGPYTSTKPNVSGDVTWDVQIINITNQGDIVVKKKTYDENNQLIENDSTAVNGFSMQLFKADANGNPTGTALKTVVTSGSGTNAGRALFSDVDVYDSNGNVIKYVIVEKYNTDQEKIFYTDSFKSDASPVEAVLGTTPADAGYVYNHRYMAVNVTKKYYDAREHELTGLEYPLAGATIALYRNNGDGTYTYIDDGTTNSKGKLAFGTLKYAEHGYVAIEVSIPDDPAYQYMVPVSGNYLEKVGGQYPTTLTAEQVAALSKVDLVSTTDPKYTGTIYNQIPWTQIHVTKWNENKTVKLDGADFTLYKQILPEGTTSGELTFDAANCTVVGEYTSGTWIHDGQAQTGEFQTDVLDNADNVVYWLVETRPPDGYSIIDSENYVLFTREGTTYTNNSNEGKSTMVYTYNGKRLQDNMINYHDVLDEPGQGPGERPENRAFIEFTKWMQKESTINTPHDQLARTDFTLMPNATFELYAVNASDHNKVYLIDTITTGDENTMQGTTTGYGVSKALDAWDIFDYIEANFPDQLDKIITYQSDTSTGYDVTYPYRYDQQGRKLRIRGTFKLNAVLVEKSGSSAYGLDIHDHNLQITFSPNVSGHLNVGNDKYCVTDITDTSADFCDANEERRLSYTFNNSGSMAIVDYLVIDNAVVLRHFGYDPQLVGYNLLTSQLDTKHDNNPSLFVSKKVKFALERYNGATHDWEAWSPTDNAKVTGSGTNEFEADGNGYSFDSGLDAGNYRVVMTVPADGYENFYPESTPFYFTVVTSDRTQTFTTYSPSRPDVTIKKTELDGTAITKKAKFKLESKTSGITYSEEVETENGTAVFEKLPAGANYKLTETVAPEGYSTAYFAQLFKNKYPNYASLVEAAGYPLSYELTTRTNADNHSETVIVDKNYKDAFALDVPNTKDVKLKLIKKDAQAGTLLRGAQFRIYYLAFNKVSGDYSVPDFNANQWQNLGLVTTGADGTIIVDDNSFAGDVKINPGVYYAVEVVAPPHYELNTTGQTIVMTGGLPLTIAQSDKYTVWTSVEQPGELEFEDIPLKGITVEKKVEFGDLPQENYSFSFTLKDSEGQSITGSPATATGPNNPTKAAFTDLVQGDAYYLKEATKAGYKLDSVKIGNNPISPETSGTFKDYYKITMPSDGSGVEVTVTNILMKAQVTIFKYDGHTGDGLTGAQFEVLDADGHVVSNAGVTDNGDGSYTAVIPLESLTGTDFYIHETKAPEIAGKKYTIDDANDRIEVKGLKPGENRSYTFNGASAGSNQYCLPNYEGIDVTILKYGGLPEGNHSELAGAKFQMYFSTNGGQSWNTWHPAETTGTDGKATFRILKGYKYAVAEINDVQGYVGLYGVYNDQNEELPTTTSADNRTLYILGDAFENNKEYQFTGYNIPYLKLTVNKHDWNKDNNKPNAVDNPNTTFHVYEVPNGTPETLTDAQIAALIDGNNKYIVDETTNSTYTNEQFIQPGKTYLAVENHAKEGGSTQDKYSIIKDDTRVTYYQVFSVPEKNYEAEYTVDFVNLKGDATVEIDKTVDKDTVDSLTTKEAELTYTLTPSGTNGYALDSYKINDSGLTPDPTDATLADEWYDITEVIVGQGKMDKYLKGVKANKDYYIYAKVTFVDFAGNEYPQNAVNVSNGNITVTPSGDAEGKKIKSFFVEYYSPELITDTGYALGQNFEAGETKVKVTVFKQDSSNQKALVALKKIRNDADVELKYTPWSPEGVKKAQETLDDDAYAITEVDGVKAPKISFSKDGPDPDTALQLGHKIKYTLTVTNVTGEDIDFPDPVIVDLLPQGVSIDQNSQFVTVTDKPDTINDNPTITTGYAGNSPYVNIAFKGTIGDGESIVVELEATVTTAVTNYGATLRNFAFTTSEIVGVPTSDNTTGAIIKDDQGNWASELVSLAKRLGCDEARAQALKTVLGEQGTYGYLGDWHENFWESESGLVCVKAEYGPSDGGIYRTDKVSLVYNENAESQRTMHYQLTINNITQVNRTNLAVMDIMPTVGDQRINNTTRGSHWPLYFDAIDADNVKVNGAKCTNYTVYYYIGDDITTYDATKITDTLNTAKAGGLDSNEWSTTKPDNATAFILVFGYDPNEDTNKTTDKTVVLEGGKQAVIEYTATTPYREAEQLNPIVFTNASNDFNFGFSTILSSDAGKKGAKAAGTKAGEDKANSVRPNTPLGSNVVEVTITPPYVKVGGDVWIDADSNGWQDDGDQSWYLNYDIVKQLVGDAANNVSGDLNVKLITSASQVYTNILSTTQGAINKTGSDPNNYGVAHFEFDQLTAAKLRDQYSGQYTNWNSTGDATKLVGDEPYTYHMTMDYTGNVFTKTINNVDPRGSYVPGNIPDDDQTDDNFADSQVADYQTEQFFLHQTSDVFDMTKDYGVNIPKTLELTKVNMSNETETIAGAVFELYGPFEHGTGKTATLSSSNLVDTLTTDPNGKISKDGLFFFKEYVIVEKQAGQGFSIDGATATGNIEKIEEGKWLLKPPAYDASPSADKPYTESVTVKDPGTIEVSVEKQWNGNEDEYDARPDSIKVMLYTDANCTEKAKYENGNTVEEKTIPDTTAQNPLKVTWTDLPRYKNSTAITYYVKETTSTGAELKAYNAETTRQTDSTTGDQSLTIKNTPYYTGLDVKKTWDDNEELGGQVVAAKFRVEQSSDGQTWTNTKKNGNDVILTISRQNGEAFDTAKVDNLPAYDKNDNPLTYRAVEIAIIVDADGQTHELEVKDGKVGPYEVTENHTPGDNTSNHAQARDLSEITNKMIPTEFNVEKTFVDDNYDFNKEIQAITVVLQRKCGNSDWFTVSDKTGADSFDLTADNEWKYKWEGLPKLRWDSEPFEYRAVEVSYTTKSGTVVQVDFNGDDLTSGTVGSYIYTSKTEGTPDDGFKTFIENKLEKTGLKVTKEWKNADDNNMPKSVTIALKAIVNGKEITLNGVPKTVVLNKANNWTDDTTWSDLPVYYVDGSKIGYQLVETTKGKYTTKYKIKLKGSIINEGEGKMLIVHVHKGSTVEAAFINTMNETDTGDGTPILPFLALCLASLAGLLTLLFGRRRTE